MLTGAMESDLAKPILPRWRPGQRPFVQLGCVVMLAFASLAMSWPVAQRSSVATDLVRHSHEVQDTIDQLVWNLLELQQAMQAQQLSGSTDALAQQVAKTRAGITRDLGTLRQLTTNNTLQQAQLVTLDQQTLQYLGDAAGTVGVQKSGGVTPLAATGIADAIGKMRVEEASVLQARSARADKLSAYLQAMVCVSIAAIILLVVLAAQSFRRMVRERDARLSQQDTELAAKDKMMREVDHRARNSLCLVHSLMTFQGQRSGNDGHTKTLLAEAANQILVVARVHERLYRTRRSDRVPADGYLREICDDVADNSMTPDAAGLIAVASVDRELPAEQAIWLGLVVVELVTNALKHGSPSPEAPVHVDVTEQDGRLLLAVSDGGQGLPADFDIKTSKGLGMQIVSLLVKQLHATLSFDRVARGARFVLSVPLAAN